MSLEYKDSFFRPERVVNYISKDRTGLGLVHVKSKCMGLFIKNLLGETTSDCYLNAVVRKYCSGEDITLVPVKPPNLTKSLIEQIKIVMLQGKSLTSKHIYQVLLNEEFEIDQNFN